MLGHARTSMTLDTYTHLFEEAAHGADVRAQLARSDFANLLTRALDLLAGEQLAPVDACGQPAAPSTSAPKPRLQPPSLRLSRGPLRRHPLLDQNLTNRFRQQARQHT